MAPKKKKRDKKKRKTPALPEGWVAHVDDESGETFFENLANGETSWTRPGMQTAEEAAAAELAADVAEAATTDEADLVAENWLELVDHDGLTLWTNSVSGHTSACKPAAIADDELRAALKSAKKARSKAAAWSAETDAGAVYWSNSETGASTWSKPQELRALDAAEAAARILPLRTQADEWAEYNDEDDSPFWFNLRSSVTTRMKPAEIVRCRFMELAEEIRQRREEAADFEAHDDDAGDTFYEFLPDASTSYDRPACLDRLAELEAEERCLKDSDAQAQRIDSIKALQMQQTSQRVAAFALLRQRPRANGKGASSHERRDMAAKDALLAGALDDAISMLRSDGLESSQLAIFVDLTANNRHKGANSFGGRSLHDVSDTKRPNPYQQVIATIGRTLAPFDSDGLIPLYGFGCSQSIGKAVLPLHFAGGVGAQGSDEPENFAKGFAHALAIYTRRLASGAITLSGPTNFAPAIRKSIELAKASGARELTICLILTSSQVEARIATEAALKDASKLPIAIVVVGVGDGPFDNMARLDDDVGSRLFDNLCASTASKSLTN